MAEVEGSERARGNRGLEEKYEEGVPETWHGVREKLRECAANVSPEKTRPEPKKGARSTEPEQSTCKNRKDAREYSGHNY
jgi:hypothetical protein